MGIVRSYPLLLCVVAFALMLAAAVIGAYLHRRKGDL